MDSNIRKAIAEKFNIKVKDIGKLEQAFSDYFLSNSAGESAFRIQYLAHFIRSFESLIRNKSKSPLFRIVVKLLAPEAPLPSIGTAYHVPKKSFVVYVHPELDPKQQRIIIAHEIGHLLVCELLDMAYGENGVEGIASIFGILTILDRNEFYKNKCKDYIYKNPNDIIDDFILMSNRANGKYNIS